MLKNTDRGIVRLNLNHGGKIIPEQRASGSQSPMYQ